MRIVFNRTMLIVCTISFLTLSCHKKSDNPSPSASACYLESVWSGGVRSDSFVYNSNNQLTEALEYDDAGIQSSLATITYNSNGTISKFTINFFSDSTIFKNYWITSNQNYYNSLGQLTYQLIYNNNLMYNNNVKTDSVVFLYNSSGYISTMIDYSVVNLTPTFIAYYTYDGNGNVLTEKDSSSNQVQLFTYTYDTKKIPYATLITNAYTLDNEGIDMAYLNGKNNLVSMVYTLNGVNQSDSFNNSYSYNSNNYPVGETTTGGQTFLVSNNYSCK